jgi:hypothetical protein
MFDNSIGAFTGILHPLWNWGAPRPPIGLRPLLRMRCSGIAEDQHEEREESVAKNEEPAETNRGVTALMALLAHFFLENRFGWAGRQ